MSLLERPDDAETIVPLDHVKSFWEDGYDHDVEALFLTFNADPTFLEAKLLDGCRESGAVVTVLADARMWAPDVGTVRSAGREYHVGLIAGRRAFHPKVSMLVGPKRAIAIVGSGNLGLAGWQGNSELATVLIGNRDSAPSALADLRDVLATLPEHAELDATSADAVRRAVDRLSTLLQQTAEVIDTRHHVFASWNGPLLQHLPTGPVDELLITAAFHDQSSQAVRLLLERTQPRRVRVAVQPGLTVFDPVTLREVLRDFASETGADVAVVRDGDSAGRYRHGKLIEWAVNGERAALTGSPNLTTAALLSDASTGNHEVAIIGPTDHSLFPDGEVLDLRSPLPLGCVVTMGGASTRGGPVIIAAALTDTGVRLNLARVTTKVEIEALSSPHADGWTFVCHVRQGSKEVDLPFGPRGGTALRLAWTTVDGERRYSVAQFVTDRSTAQQPKPRPNPPGPPDLRVEWADVWGEDLNFIDGVRSRLARYATDLSPTRSAASKASRSGGRGGGGDDARIESWAWLRVVMLAVSVKDPNDPWQVRAARRQWAEKAAKKSAQPSVPLWACLYFLVGTVTHWQRHTWKEGDSMPLFLVEAILRKVVDSYGALDNETARSMRGDVSTLAAIALVLLRTETNVGVHDEVALIYQQLKRDCRSLMGGYDPDLAVMYLQGIERLGDVSHWLGLVTTLAKGIVYGDPFGDVSEWLDRQSRTISIIRPNANSLHVTGDFSSAGLQLLALEAVGRADDQCGVAVWTSNPQGDWALVVWRRPDLVIVWQDGGKVVKWRHRSLGGLIGPASLAYEFRKEGYLPRGVEIGVTRPKFRRTDAAMSVLRAVGVEGPQPPAGSAEPNERAGGGAGSGEANP